MSWLISAMNRAAEVGGRNSLGRTVRGYADSVVQQAGNAVVEGKKMFQDRIGSRNFQSIKNTIKRLEEVSVSCKGQERILLLRRWLVSLKQIEKITRGNQQDNDEKTLLLDPTSDELEPTDSTQRPTLVLYYDNDLGGEPMNFRDVFLHSQALEGITLSMIIEAPDEEEVALLREIFRLCLMEGKEIQNAILSSIQDLAKAFSCYQDEVLVKQEELLQFAQSAIAGLKINADVLRIDAKATSMQKKLEEMKTAQHSLGERHENEEPTFSTIEALKEALVQIELCSQLEAMLQKKKILNNGDSPNSHAQKVDKLKILSESLASSIKKAEKRIADHRYEREEALNFRDAKSSEVSQLEKELASEIGALEKQRDELEAQLKKVNTALTTALARLHNVNEEKKHFDEASNEIVALLETKEDEVSRSIASYRAESSVVNTWINFLEDTWVIQLSYTNQKEKQVNYQLERYEDYFVDLVIFLLSAYKVELAPSITRVRTIVEELNSSERSEIAVSIDAESPIRANPRKNLEEKYLNFEAMFITAFSVVDSLKRQFYDQKEDITRKDDQRVKELFDALGNIKDDFESVKRPVLDIETPRKRVEPPSKKVIQKNLSFNPKPRTGLLSYRQDKFSRSHSSNMSKIQHLLDSDAELERLESEVGKANSGYSAEEITDWEFDALEAGPNGSSSTRSS